MPIMIATGNISLEDLLYSFNNNEELDTMVPNDRRKKAHPSEGRNTLISYNNDILREYDTFENASDVLNEIRLYIPASSYIPFGYKMIENFTEVSEDPNYEVVFDFFNNKNHIVHHSIEFTSYEIESTNLEELAKDVMDEVLNANPIMFDLYSESDFAQFEVDLVTFLINAKN